MTRTLTWKYSVALMIVFGALMILAGYESTSMDLSSSQGYSVMKQMALTAGY